MKNFYYFQFICLLGMLLFSGIFENHINCSSSVSAKSHAVISSSLKKRRYSKRFNRKKAKATSKKDWGPLLGAVKSFGLDLVTKVLESSKAQENDLFKGISSGLGYLITDQFSQCLKENFGEINSKVTPLIQRFQKFIKDIQNPSGHLQELTDVAGLCKEAYNSVSVCNAKRDTSPGIMANIGIHALELIKKQAIEKGHKYLEEQAKQKLPADIANKIGNFGLISLSLATEMSTHIQNYHYAKAEEEKGKHLGLLIKAVIDSGKGKKKRRRYK